ncbi:MAG: hypothetical protein Q8R76_07625 [Candidatus Omnitrophota bacterium]|nr:hypothetical protein [Candidatus Omnitrophota bacterium]
MSLIHKALDKANGRGESAPKRAPVFAKPRDTSVFTAPAPESEIIPIAQVEPHEETLAQPSLSKEYLFFAILFAGILAVLAYYSLGLKATETVPSEPTVVKAAASQRVTTLRPPVVPQAKSGVVMAQEEFLLSGISNIGNNLIAIINGQVVAVGDVLQEGPVVKAIQGRKVVLDSDGVEVHLTLY